MEAIGHADLEDTDLEATKHIGVNGSSHCMQCGHLQTRLQLSSLAYQL